MDRQDSKARERGIARLTRQGREAAERVLADEAPVSLAYNGCPHAVMMLTPQDLEDFAVGFSLTERIADHPNQISAVSVQIHERGIVLDVKVEAGAAKRAREQGARCRGRQAAACAASPRWKKRWQIWSRSLRPRA